MHTNHLVPRSGRGHCSGHWQLALLVALALALASGCTPAGGNSPPATTSVGISLDFNSPSHALGSGLLAALSMEPLAATADDVASITVDVSQGATALVIGAALTRDPVSGIWSGTVGNLPVGVSLTFTAHAYDSEATEIFSGTTQITLTGGAQTVTIAMAPPQQPAFVLPRIVAIQVPDSVLPDASAPVSFSFEGNADETLNWTLTPAAGSFSQTAGTLLLSSSGQGTVAVTYTAPTTAGTYTHTVQLTNSQGNSVATTFSIVVASATSNVVVQFAPVVTSIVGSRQGNTVTWTAAVSDTATPLSYAWSANLTGGSAPAFRTPGTTNPAFLDGYDETVEGTLTLQVTDANSLSTTVTINLAAGQFPDSVVVYPAQGLTYVDGDGVPEMTGVPSLTPSPFSPGDTVTVSVPVDSDVGYVAACLYAHFADASNLFQDLQIACTEQWSRTPATGIASHPLPVGGVLEASDEYWLVTVVCIDTNNCDNLTGTVYTSDNGASTYSRQVWDNMLQQSSVDTGVAIPTFSSPGGALGITYVNGDGVAEMTAAPTYSTSSVTIGVDTSMVISVPVDADAGSVCIDVGNGWNLGNGFQTGSEGDGCVSFAPGTEQTVDVTVTFSGLTAGTHSATISVGLNPSSPDNTNTSWNYASTRYPGTFRVVKYPGTTNGVESETGTPIPTFEAVP